MSFRSLALAAGLFEAARAVANVTLDDGTLVLGSSRLPGTTSYWGIRYGEAARFQAATRWSPPTPGVVIDGRLNDTLACWQAVDGTESTEGVEDCLFLDLSAPVAPEEGGAAAMVWIHGGGLVAGRKGLYSDDLLNFVAEGGVVVVSINYRLNVMGFFAAEGVSPNNGIRDQILALQWVQANVARFGGDPQRVTIFGESAGGLSVMVLHQSPLAQGLFHRAIAQSPAWQDVAQFQRPVGDAAAGLSAACLQDLGCESVECLRQKSADEFRACAMTSGPRFIGKQGSIFTGYDGEVLPTSLYSKLCSGEPSANAAVPLIVGSLPHEWRFFQRFAKYGLYDASGPIRTFLAEYLDGYSEADANERQCVEWRLLDMYEGAAALNNCPACADFTGIEAEVQLAGDIEMTLGAQLLATSSGGPRFRYLFDNTASGAPGGATHAADVAYFNADPGSVDLSFASTAEKTALGQELRQLWTSFAKSGVPSEATSAWPSVDPASGPLGLPMLRMRLGEDALERNAWFTNATGSILADIACGRATFEDFDCLGSTTVV